MIRSLFIQRPLILLLMLLPAIIIGCHEEGHVDSPDDTPSQNQPETSQDNSTGNSGTSPANVTFPLVLQTQSFVDPTLPDIEPTPGSYGFSLPAQPVPADFFAAALYSPAQCDVPFKDTYGPRLLSDNFDNHAGWDFECCGVVNGGITYNCTTNPPVIRSICNGTVYDLDFANKGSAYVECNESYISNPAWGKIRVVYRHLASFDPALSVGGAINVGDAVGIMGNTDASKVHLHFSARSSSSSRNRHPARLFNPNHSVFFNFLDSADIRVLHNSTQAVTFRIAIPGNMLGINIFQFDVKGNSPKTVTYNSEEVIRTANGSAERDDPGFINGLKIYAYGYNGYKPVCDEWEDDKDNLPASYPASPQRSTGLFFPILCNDAPIYNQPSLVYDVVLQVDEPIANNELASKIHVKLIDVFGYGVKSLSL